MNSLHHAREHPQISNFLQFESQSSKSFKVRAISELKDLYGNKIRGLTQHASFSRNGLLAGIYQVTGRRYWYRESHGQTVTVG